GAPCGGAPRASWVLIACPLLYLSAAVCEVRRGCDAAHRRPGVGPSLRAAAPPAILRACRVSRPRGARRRIGPASRRSTPSWGGPNAPRGSAGGHPARGMGLAHPGDGTTRRHGGAGLVALALGAWGLDADRPRTGPPPAPELAAPAGESAGGAPDGTAPVRPRLAAVPATTTVVDVTDPVALATGTSALLYDEAPVVALAPADDPAAQARAASAAVAVGGPLLLTPPDPGPTGVAPQAAQAQAAAPASTVADEVDRLRPRAVLAVGTAAVRWARAEVDGADVVAAPDGADLRTATGLALGDDVAVAPGDLVAAVAGLDRERPALITVEEAAAGPAGDATAGTGEPEAAELPAVAPADPPDEVLAVVEAGDAAVAAVATARASGARVVPYAGGDPRADPAAIAALAGAPLPERVVVLGAGLGPAERVRPRLEVAATGTELPGGGQVLFPGRRMIALYGHPGAPVLGVLGEQPVE